MISICKARKAHYFVARLCLWGSVVTTRLFVSFIFNCLICVYMCLCVIIYPWV